MLRILIYLIAMILVTAGITALSNLTGRTAIRIGDTLVDVPSGVFLGMIVLGLVLTIVTTLITSGLWRLPKTISRQREEGRRAKGMIALTRGLEAVAAGDAADAQRHARLALKNLDEPGVTRLLTAQAAQLAGDEDTATQSFAAMLEAPETEFLGLRGLYLQSLAAGNRKEAREFAERAFKLRPGTEWAYTSVFNLNVERGAWGDARDALQLARQHGLEAGDSSKRREAVLLTAQAYAADNAQDTETALHDAEAALKKAPGFAPAAVLAARLEAQSGRRSKAGRILDEAWALQPHPAIARTMREFYTDESVERRTGRLKRLAEKAALADESILLLAEQDIELEDFGSAREKLEPLLTKTPRARTFAAMAAAMRGLHGPEAAQYWLDRAAAAPLDPVPGADGVFHFTRDGWIGLIREYGEHGRLAPPPLEEIHTGISREDIKLLTAPPPVPETPIEVEPAQEEISQEPSPDLTIDASEEDVTSTTDSASDPVTENESKAQDESSDASVPSSEADEADKETKSTTSAGAA